jgi:plasmid stabilization system protein ParE
MAYRVEIARRAESDLEELYLWVVERAPQRGARWFNGLEFDPDHPVRVLTYGRKPHAYRIFFTVDDDVEIVRVLHVRRGARQRPMAEELRGE